MTVDCQVAELVFQERELVGRVLGAQLGEEVQEESGLSGAEEAG